MVRQHWVSGLVVDNTTGAPDNLRRSVARVNRADLGGDNKPEARYTVDTQINHAGDSRSLYE